MTKQKWVDLSAYDIYVGDQKMADGRSRLVVLDMQDRGDVEKLQEIGLMPFKGSPRYEKGIYYLQGNDQRLRPRALARAFGLDNCPIIDIEKSEISRVFKEKALEKFGTNINAVTHRSTKLGVNPSGLSVYSGPTGRFVRVSAHRVVLESSEQAAGVEPSVFLRATNEVQLRACAKSFVKTIQDGGKTNWNDVKKFAHVIFEDPSDAQLHRLQEAIEAVSYQHFNDSFNEPNEKAFKAATDYYYGLPVARMRTAQSVFLQQYSTPQPMSVVAQRLLLAQDNLEGKTVLEPSVGNGGLVNLMPDSVKVYGCELDEKRLDAISGSNITTAQGDATKVIFEQMFNEFAGFDYSIANPPFGQMDQAQPFDKIPSVRRQDLYIALRTLQARKDNGRSVLILGADSSQSDGTIKGGAIHFMNYIHDHYDVHGAVEIDGRMYARNGAAFNIRMIVVGDKKLEPTQSQAPTQLPILTSYDDLWHWSEAVLEKIANNELSHEAQAEQEPEQPQPTEPVAETVAVEDPVIDINTPLSVDFGVQEPAFNTEVPEREVLGVAANQEHQEQPVQQQEEVNIDDVEPQVGQDAQPTTEDTNQEQSQADNESELKDTEPENRLYHYGLMSRPAGIGTGIAQDFEAITDVVPENVHHARVASHGVVSFSRKLSNEEVARAELSVLIQDETEYSEIIDTFLTNEVSKYGPDYAALINSGKKNAKSVGQELLVQLRNYERRTFGGPCAFESGDDSAMRLGEMVVSRFTSQALEQDSDANQHQVQSSIENLEPWQLTQTQWQELYSNAENKERLEFDVRNWRLPTEDGVDGDQTLDVTHREVIEKAITQGLEVPDVVLSDYLDIEVASDRSVNEFQAPYQSASRVGETSTMIPINMAGATYAALNRLEAKVGPIDVYVANKLQYKLEDLGSYFSPEQVDALGLGIDSIEQGRGMINADQTGVGKGRYVAGLLRYAKLTGKIPIFLTISPDLFTDIYRDISDIGSLDLFEKPFIFNNAVNVKRFGSEDEVLFPATTPKDRNDTIKSGVLPDGVDIVLSTYSQFMRKYESNTKAQLLVELASQDAMLVLDESHVAAGSSNIGDTVQQAVTESAATMYASATPLKGVENFALYSKVFPESVDLLSLPDTLRSGGEALQEAISANMAQDGVLVRRELDFSGLVFHTRNPSKEIESRNRELADKLADIVSGLSYISGDVDKMVSDINKDFKTQWDSIPEADRQGRRMNASSMNFGSRLYNINRQFLLGIKIEEAVQTALEDLENGRKPVIAVENTGESLLRQVLSRRLNIDDLELELEDLNERLGGLNADEQQRREDIIESINTSLKGATLDEPPQFRELLEIMLDRIGKIKVQGRYGEVEYREPDSKEYKAAVESLKEKIKAFPDLALTPIDVIKKELSIRGFPVAEVSGRTASLSHIEGTEGDWNVNFHAKGDAVANVAGFQNGNFDAIVITRSGSTGISLHATDRFEDSDIRQRNFIVLQKAANIAEFLQWMGRVNRKGQVVSPRITTLESGLPAELRLTMMHNAKLRKLSANTTSNRQNANLEGEDFDLLNDVGDKVALQWLMENPDIAENLDIKLPEDGPDESGTVNLNQEAPYINKLMGRLLMVGPDKQEEILNAISSRFAERIEELNEAGVNPFKVDVYEWGAEVVHEEELQSGVLQSSGSTFDEPVKIATLKYQVDIKPIRVSKLKDHLKVGEEDFAYTMGSGGINSLKDDLRGSKNGWVRKQLPMKLRESEESLEDILRKNEQQAPGAVGAMHRANWLVNNLSGFRPGVLVEHEDLLAGKKQGMIVSVTFPQDRKEQFLLSKYRARVAFPGENKLREITLATMRSQDVNLLGNSFNRFDINKNLEDYPVGTRRKLEYLLDSFDNAADGVITRTQHVLSGNIFRACEIANEQRLGTAALFTDAEGNRQRAVLLKDRVTPDMVKALPIGLDAKDIALYTKEYLDPSNPDFYDRVSPIFGFRFYNSAVKDMKAGDGIMIQTINSGRQFKLVIPGTKARAGSLMGDGYIFDLGEKTPDSSLRLQLSGTRTSMSAVVENSDLPKLLDLLQRHNHVGKFYIPEPDHEILDKLKAQYEKTKSNDSLEI